MFDQAFKNIDNALRNEAGCATELDYIEQTSWLLFLKYLDGMEDDRKSEAELEGRRYTYILSKEYRWDTWAAPKDKSGAIDHNKARKVRHTSPEKIGQVTVAFPGTEHEQREIAHRLATLQERTNELRGKYQRKAHDAW